MFGLFCRGKKTEAVLQLDIIPDCVGEGPLGVAVVEVAVTGAVGIPGIPTQT